MPHPWRAPFSQSQFLIAIIMSTLFKIIFSPFRIVWWFCKLAIWIAWIPMLIVWHILKTISPELTRPFEGLAAWLAGLFRLF